MARKFARRSQCLEKRERRSNFRYSINRHLLENNDSQNILIKQNIHDYLRSLPSFYRMPLTVPLHDILFHWDTRVCVYTVYSLHTYNIIISLPTYLYMNSYAHTLSITSHTGIGIVHTIKTSDCVPIVITAIATSVTARPLIFSFTRTQSTGYFASIP